MLTVTKGTKMWGVCRRAALMVAALSVVVGLGSGLVGAQGTGSGGNGFRVSPVRSEYIIDKGKSETMSVTVENPTDAQVVAKAVVNDFVASDQENGEPRLILDENAPRPKNSFKDLVGNLADLTLAPRQSKDLKITIRVPLDANSGGYYGAVRFVPVTSTGAGNVGLTASVGTIVLVKVPGDLTEKLDLVQLSAAQKGKTKGFITGGDVNVITRLKNTGNIHVQPFGKVQVKNMFGKVIKEYELNSTDPRANVLPDSIRRFDDGIGKVGFKWLGRNTITANIGYSQGSGDLITASSRFWYLPLWFLIVLLLLVIAIVGGLFWVISRRRGSGSRRRR